MSLRPPSFSGPARRGIGGASLLDRFCSLGDFRGKRRPRVRVPGASCDLRRDRLVYIHTVKDSNRARCGPRSACGATSDGIPEASRGRRRPGRSPRTRGRACPCDRESDNFISQLAHDLVETTQGRKDGEKPELTFRSLDLPILVLLVRLSARLLVTTISIVMSAAGRPSFSSHGVF